MIMQGLQIKIGNLIENSNIIQKYHADKMNKPTYKNESDSFSSAQSISSADERDMDLLFNGEHTYQFQAESLVKKMTQDN